MPKKILERGARCSVAMFSVFKSTAMLLQLHFIWCQHRAFYAVVSYRYACLRCIVHTETNSILTVLKVVNMIWYDMIWYSGIRFSSQISGSLLDLFIAQTPLLCCMWPREGVLNINTWYHDIFHKMCTWMSFTLVCCACNCVRWFKFTQHFYLYSDVPHVSKNLSVRGFRTNPLFKLMLSNMNSPEVLKICIDNIVSLISWHQPIGGTMVFLHAMIIIGQLHTHKHGHTRARAHVHIYKTHIHSMSLGLILREYYQFCSS